MKLLAKINDRMINLEYVISFEKEEDTKIIFIMRNSMRNEFEFPDSDTRDNVYQKIFDEFVLDTSS